jgi:hypothetical protein
MRRSKKLLLGILTGWPFVYFIGFFLFVISMIVMAPGGGGELGVIPGILFLLVMVLHFATIFLILGLLIFYIVNAGKSEKFTQGEKIAWIVALFFGGMIAMPIYWYMNIWKGTPDDADYKELADGYDFESATTYDSEERREAIPRKPHNWR